MSEESLVIDLEAPMLFWNVAAKGNYRLWSAGGKRWRISLAPVNIECIAANYLLCFNGEYII